MSHIVLSEFAEIAQYYPIFFCKDSDSGQFQPVALFGLCVDENIYQASGLWQKCYVPLKIKSQPFYLLDSDIPIKHQAKLCLAIDINDAAVQKTAGEALFIDQSPTPYLQQKIAMLEELTKGFVDNNGFVAALLNNDLLEPLALEIKYNNGQQHRVDGLYTINKTMLENVPTSNQTEFEQLGYVALIQAALSSVNHVSTLIAIKNNLMSQQ
jgi:hypothetical protein